MPSGQLKKLPHPILLSAFWFGSAFHWLMLLLILMPANVVQFVGEEQKGLAMGSLTAIGAVMALLLPPIVGAQSDRRGKRLPYLIWGTLINLLGLGVMGLAVSLLQGQMGFWVYVLGFVIVQLGYNYATAPYSALIPQLIPQNQRGRYSGVMAMLNAGGQLCGAVTAFALGHIGLPHWVSFSLIALFLSIPAIMTIRGLGEYDNSPPITEKQSFNLIELFAYQPFFWVFVTRVLFALGQYSVQPFIQYYARDYLGQSNAAVATSILLAGIIIGSIVSAFIGGKVSDDWGRKPVIYIAGALMATAAILLLLAPNFISALLIALLFGLGYGAFTSVDWALGSDAMPNKENYARDMGIWHIAFTAPQFISAPGGALLDWGNLQKDNMGYTLVFGMAAIFFITGVILVRNVPKTSETSSSLSD